MNRKAIIFGVKSYKLSKKERIFLKKSKPWGIILFSRNIKNLSQLKKLTSDIKKIFSDKNYPILIDQEGGKVSRLNKIINLDIFSQYSFGDLYNKNKKLFYIVYKIYINKICEIFKNVGININTVPVLDVIRLNKPNFIEERSFSNNANLVSKLGKLCIKLYQKNRIGCISKHIPGHGMTKLDSHFETPIVNTNKKELFNKDFKPFKLCKTFFSMTAHVIYSKIDPNNTATHSKIIINHIIRRHMNFNGLLISDDISMKSLKYKIEVNATKALQSGCNLILHCNANLSEMSRLMKVIPKIDNFTKKKTSQFYNFLR